ncbi:MAG: AraC family transcriptional regulator [Clostridiaceae bacterium]|nr:AraC family transcriptional regulator [Clostridiaceae bacterium]
MSFKYAAEDNSFNFHHTIDKTPHQRDFSLHYEKAYEIYLFIRGVGEYNIEGTKYQLEPGAVLIMAPSEIHNLVISENEVYERMVLKIDRNFTFPFIAHGIDCFRAFKFRKLGQGNKINAKIVEQSGLKDLLEKVAFHCSNGGMENELVAKCIIVQILYTINNVVEFDHLPAAPADNNKITDILEYINANLSEQLSLTIISEKFFITKYHLCHIFKKATGFSLNKYIIYKRIMLTDRLILEGSLPTEACFASGFHDYSNFYKAYKKITGKTPRETAKSS